MLNRYTIIISHLLLAVASGINVNETNEIDSVNRLFETYIKENGFSTGEYDPNILEDAFLKVPQLLIKYGYRSEVHHVTTVDGYILEMHRIPNPGAQPVLIIHGLLDSSSSFVIMGPNKGLAYMLADLGYDVWLGNVRGNRYSKNHTTLNPKKSKFWQFTFHEIGVYDLPAMIDYILDSTGYQKVHYIAHSQGTTIFWVMSSERPEYSRKVMSMQALAPIAFLNSCKSPIINFMAIFQNSAGFLLRLIGKDEFLPNSEFFGLFMQTVCNEQAITQVICTNIFFLLAGYNEEQLNKTMMPIIMSHTPAGASTKQILHFGQVKRSGQFRQYDYGIVKNLMTYGKSAPPKYDLSKVYTKVALYYSPNDWLAQPSDVEQLHLQLPNPIGKFLVSDRKFNHLDFLWGIDVRELLYDRVVKTMKLVEKGEI